MVLPPYNLSISHAPLTAFLIFFGMEVHFGALFLNTELAYPIGVTPVTLFFSCPERRHSALKGEKEAGRKREERSNIRLSVSCTLDCKRSKQCICPLKKQGGWSLVEVSFTWSREPNLHPRWTLSLRHPFCHIFCQPHCPSTSSL